MDIKLYVRPPMDIINTQVVILTKGLYWLIMYIRAPMEVPKYFLRLKFNEKKNSNCELEWDGIIK